MTYKDLEKKKAYYDSNKERLKIRQKEYRLNHPEIRADWLKNNKERLFEKRIEKEYGLGVGAYNSMLIGQDFKCAICRCDLDTDNKKKTHIDHDHGRDLVRGILCMRCNLILGLCDDSQEVLLSAVDYLKDRS